MDWTPARIKALRERLGLSQSALAEMLGFAKPQSVSDLERGALQSNGKPLTPNGHVQRLLDVLDTHGLDVMRPKGSSGASLAAELRRIAAEVERLEKSGGGQ